MNHKILPLTINMQWGDVSNIVHPTLLWDADNIILVDCGFVGALELVEKELQQHGLLLEQLTGLVLTHHDHDHMGAAAALKRRCPHLKIYSLAAEEPFISAREKPLRLRQAEDLQKVLPPEQQEFGVAFCKLLRQVEPVAVDCILQEGESLDWCGGCLAIATPGHTPGHLSLLMQSEKIVITGDAFALEENQPVIANPQFTLDMAQATASMNKLLALNANAYYCYHGGIYTPKN